MSENSPTRPFISITSPFREPGDGVDLSSALQPILNLTSIIGLAAYLWIAFQNALDRQPLIPLALAPLLALLLLVTFRRKLSTALRSGFLVAFYLLVGITVILLGQTQSFGLLLLLTGVQIAFVFWNESAGIISFFVSLVLIILAGIFLHFGLLQPFGLEPQPLEIIPFIGWIATFILANWTLAVINRYLLKAYSMAASSEKRTFSTFERGKKKFGSPY